MVQIKRETITERAYINWICTHLYVVEIYKNNQHMNNSRYIFLQLFFFKSVGGRRLQNSVDYRINL
jgi:hypothetical protein